TISVTTRPHPPWRLTSRRNAESVMPAIGATPSGTSSGVDPIWSPAASFARFATEAREAGLHISVVVRSRKTVSFSATLAVQFFGGWFFGDAKNGTHLIGLPALPLH